MKKMNCLINASTLSTLAVWLGCAAPSEAALLINFPFNEGSGSNVTDTASSLIGTLGVQQNPAVDYVQLMDASPSGLPGDRCITNSGNGFLVADDSATRVLDITNGPITMETWTYIDPSTPAKAAEGIMGYGFSYKMGMKGGVQVFTLFGIADITNSAAGFIPVGQWVHLAAAWQPGVGVYFFVNGVASFVAHTSPAARPVQHNYLTLAAENLGNTSVAAFDRMRIHHALLTNVVDLDTVAATPKAPLASTKVAYNFNEAAFPCTNSVAPPLPTTLSSAFLPSATSPVWTNDTPTRLPGDFALAFLTERPPTFEFVAVPYGGTPINLGENNTNYSLQAWVKLPTGPMEERRVIYRSDGPAPRISLSINSTRTLHTTVLGTADFVTTVPVPNDNRWHHIGVVMEDFARLRFYLDGILRQTVNRTQTAVATGGGTPGLTIGKESETRYFRGVLDRVIIHNNALTNSTLDYPAIPGLATFDTLASHPVDVVTNAGSTTTFTGGPTSSSAATYQWRYRTNLADQTSAALPGQTSTNLTLNNVGAGNEGFYFLVVSNAAGVSESYAARLTLRTSLGLNVGGFEVPKYKSGPLEEQDYWTNDQNGNAVRVLTSSEIAAALQAGGRPAGQTVHGGSQALLVNGVGLATATLRTVTGFETETNVTLDVWVRPLAIGTVGNAIGNVFLTMENAAGIRAAGFRLGPALSLDYGTTNIVTPPWQATGITADSNTWYRITMNLNYGTRTYDFLLDGQKLNANPIQFYDARSDSFRQIRISRGANQAGMILDDLTVTAPAGAPRITQVTVAGSTVTVNWTGGQPPYQLQRRSNVASGTWADVGGPTNSTQATDTLGPGTMFYRVGSN